MFTTVDGGGKVDRFIYPPWKQDRIYFRFIIIFFIQKEIIIHRAFSGDAKVMRCSRYGDGGRMHVILNGERLEEVDCFKYLGVASGS